MTVRLSNQLLMESQGPISKLNVPELMPPDSAIFAAARPNRRFGMGKVIEFYIPLSYIPKQRRWTRKEDRGKVLEFAVRKSA